jgi:hypothetical protein
MKYIILEYMIDFEKKFDFYYTQYKFIKSIMYFIFSKQFTLKCHKPWDYNMFQNCEKIFNSIKSMSP